MSVSGCLLLSAGRGRRLKPLTDALPKPALPLLDIPLGAFGLTRLALSGRPVTVNLHHLAGEARAALQPYDPQHATDCFVERPEAFGTAGTLAALAGRWPESVATWNCDLLSDLSIGDLVATHESRGASLTLAVEQVEHGADFATEGGVATAFIDRRRRPSEAGARFIGAAVFERRALDLLPTRRPAGLGETLFEQLADKGGLAVHVHEGYALDVGTIGRYLKASLDLLAECVRFEGLCPPGEILTVDGGRAYLGRGAAAPRRALGHGAVVLAGAVIEPGAHVERAVVWPGEVVPAGMRVSSGIWAFGRHHGE